MKSRLSIVLTIGLALVTTMAAQRIIIGQENYLGFDRNDYPGDTSLAALRKTFWYTGFWLNNPPGEAADTWTGKRPLLLQHQFGFLVLFNGRTDAELKVDARKGEDASMLGTSDGKAAAAAARKEGFPRNVLIFLDQEEGGRLLPEQADYILAWAAAVKAAGDRAGVYCSGIEVPDGSSTISTARDILAHSQGKNLALWVANDACPPSNGCAKTSQGPDESGLKEAVVWQYALSPRRAQFSAGCLSNAAADGNCYAPGLPANQASFIDMNTARTPDPSGGSR